MKRDAAARAIIRNNLQFRVVDPDQKIDIFVSPGMFYIGPPTFLRQRHPSERIDIIARTSNHRDQTSRSRWLKNSALPND